MPCSPSYDVRRLNKRHQRSIADYILRPEELPTYFGVFVWYRHIWPDWRSFANTSSWIKSRLHPPVALPGACTFAHYTTPNDGSPLAVIIVVVTLRFFPWCCHMKYSSSSALAPWSQVWPVATWHCPVGRSFIGEASLYGVASCLFNKPQ